MLLHLKHVNPQLFQSRELVIAFLATRRPTCCLSSLSTVDILPAKRALRKYTCIPTAGTSYTSEFQVKLFLDLKVKIPKVKSLLFLPVPFNNVIRIESR